MTTVTVDEARTNLSELLQRVAGGEQVVFIDGGKWVAQLSPPPAPPPTPDEIAAQQGRVKEAIKDMVLMQIRAGVRLPEDSKLRELFDAGELPP